MDENLAWLTELTEELKNQNVIKQTLPPPPPHPPTHTEQMQLNCKVIKKVATPHFYINPSHFQGYLPFLAKFWVPPPVAQFLEGPSHPLPLL